MYRNINNGKEVEFLKIDEDDFIWFMIDGLKDCLSKEVFNVVYEKL